MEGFISFRSERYGDGAPSFRRVVPRSKISGVEVHPEEIYLEFGNVREVIKGKEAKHVMDQLDISYDHDIDIVRAQADPGDALASKYFYGTCKRCGKTTKKYPISHFEDSDASRAYSTKLILEEAEGWGFCI